MLRKLKKKKQQLKRKRGPVCVEGKKRSRKEKVIENSVLLYKAR